MVVLGMPPNMDSVHAVLSCGCSLFHWRVSCAIPRQPEISDWLTIFPVRTCGTKPYASTRKPMIIPM